MAVTPNYNWPLPDNTSLVKDGAEAIRDLGNAIDTTVEDIPLAGLVHIKEEVFSAVSAVNVDNCFSANFDTYILRGSYLGSANSHCNIRLRVGGSDNSNLNYQRQIFNVSGVNPDRQRLIGQNAMVNAVGHQTTGNGALLLEFQRPFNSNPTHVISLGSSADADFILAAQSTYRFTVGTSFTGFSFICLNGNITGRLDIYAYRRP